MKITFLLSGSIRSNFSYRPLALARSLHALGHDISIIAPKADKYNNFIPEDIANIDGIRIIQPFQFTTKRLEINLLPYLFGATKSLLAEDPDLVYIYKPTPISIVGLLSKLFRNTKTVADFDDLGSEVMRIEGHPWHQRMLVAWSERTAARYSDRLVVASTHLLNAYSNKFPRKPILLVPNCIESDWLSPLIPSGRQKHIVFMGSVNRKSILDPLFDVLPEIVREHPDLSVEILGDGMFLPYFKEKAAALKLSNNIAFAGWLPLEEAKGRLHAGDIGYNWMPDELTTKAASNMKVPQYMSRGVVPIVSDVGDLATTVDHGSAGYVSKPDDIQSLKETLLFALTDQDRAGKAERARSFASERLSWNAFANTFDMWIQPKKKAGKRKMYVVATTVPGNVGGGEMRNSSLIKQLAKRAAVEIDVFCISSGDAEAARNGFESSIPAACHVSKNGRRSFISDIKAVFIKRVPPFMENFKASGIGRTFRQACEASLPDIVLIEQLSAYYCIRHHIAWLKSKGVKIVFDCHNIEFQAFKDSLEIFPFPKKMIGRFLVPHMKELEIEITKLSDAVLACSPSNADFFKTYNRKTYTIPNGVERGESRIAAEGREPVLVFMGGIGYPPNADAMEFYLTAIHPKVREHVPNVRLLAIGTDKKWLDDLDIYDPSISPLGFVEDVAPYLNEASIGICPIRYGSGTRIKIMTCMKAGLPVVSTSKGAEGVGYQNGQDIIIADAPESFAEAIVRLLNDRPYREKMAQNGLDFIAKNCDWNVIGKELASIITSV
jgi:glycosyltransferase involved in cell wall biosynthesis